MQYILSEQEIEDHNAEIKTEIERREEVIVFLVGDKCIHHSEFTGLFRYCDDKCPIGKTEDRYTLELCPMSKSWGK